MALSAAIFVGEARKWYVPLHRALSVCQSAPRSLARSLRIPELVARAKKLVVNAGHEPDADVGPVVSKKAKARIEALIQSGVDEGAKLQLDGRGVKVPKYPNGNFVGPTILTGVTPDMTCYKYAAAAAAAAPRTATHHTRTIGRRSLARCWFASRPRRSTMPSRSPTRTCTATAVRCSLARAPLPASSSTRSMSVRCVCVCVCACVPPTRSSLTLHCTRACTGRLEPPDPGAAAVL